MKSKKNGLDEMQAARRNSIGHEMFLLTFYALLLETGLYGAGFRWLQYPLNTIAIIVVSMTIYLIRTILADAYLPPAVQKRKTVFSSLLTVIFSVLLSIAAVFLFRSLWENAGNNYALVLFIFSGLGLLISLVTLWIKAKEAEDKGE
ncbi:MAG: hypothetical protein GX335_00870 [Firmicutes bacterium]|nr:hypothetical protein [Bacillota bacterium]